MLDFISKGITGKAADLALGRANITVNKNTVPNDPQSPFVTSGIRIGTPAVTTRGMKESEVVQLADWMCDLLDDIDNEQKITEIKAKVISLCSAFPVYKNTLHG